MQPDYHSLTKEPESISLNAIQDAFLNAELQKLPRVFERVMLLGIIGAQLRPLSPEPLDTIVL